MSVVAQVIDLVIFALEAVLQKSGTNGSMGGGLSKFCDGSSYAEIR